MMTREEQIKTLEDVRDCLLAIAEGRLPARSISFAGLAHDVELVRECLKDEGESSPIPSASVGKHIPEYDEAKGTPAMRRTWLEE